MGNEKIKDFTDLIVWKEGHKLVLMIYDATNNFPKNERFGLVSQMRRCAVSITSNIAEGFGRKGYKEKLQFYYVSSGSLSELKNQTLIAKDVKYLSEKSFIDIMQRADSTHKLLNLFISKTKTFVS
ncbi:MAG: four helix bundle protein [Parcubacteria group bacterium]|jgi:four helix bundle protein